MPRARIVASVACPSVRSLMRASLVAALATLLPLPGVAQVRTMPENACQKPIEVKKAGVFIDNAAAQYNRTDWASLGRAASGLVHDIAASVDSSCTASEAHALKDLLDQTKNYIALSWVGADPLSGKPLYMRVVLHGADGAEVMPPDADLPGIATATSGPHLAEVFLGRSPEARVRAVYTSTRESNPAEGQLTAFAQAIAAPMFATIASLTKQLPAGRANLQVAEARASQAAAQSIWATVERVTLPQQRASVRLQAKARDAVDADVFKEGIKELASAIALDEAAYSECERGHAADIAKALAAQVGAGPCEAGKDSAGCATALDTVMTIGYQRALACYPNRPPSQQQVDDARAVDHRFRSYILAESHASADADLTFHNRPLTKWSFGAGTALIGWAKSLRSVRVKVDGDLVKRDPVPRTMTMAFVNLSPGGYDEMAPGISDAKRFRPFLGASLTPDFGVVGGLNTLIHGDLGVALGVGVFFAEGAKEDQVDKKPTADHFGLALPGVVFIGLTYNFK